MTRLLLTFALALPLGAQLAYFSVVSNEERPISGMLAMGETVTGEPLDVLIRLRNTGKSLEMPPAIVVQGAGFSVKAAPQNGIPVGLSVDFYVRFVSTRPMVDARGILRINTTTITLQAIANAVPNVLLVESDASRTQKLAGEASLFGTIDRDQQSTRKFVLENPHDSPVAAASLVVLGESFSLVTRLTLPLVLAPRAAQNLEVVFQPRKSGILTGALLIDQRRYPLEGAGKDPPTPKPLLTVGPEIQQSGKQVRISVQFDAAARADAGGRVRVEFTPKFLGPDDAGVMFPSTNSRSVAFGVKIGEQGALFSGNQRETLLQTGTTAGTIRVIAEMGGYSAESTYTIAPASVMVDTLTARRAIGAMELTVRGFDNSRSASEVAFTFFDAAGQTILPGQLRVEVAEKFRKYFESPPAGGLFALLASFPATGSTTGIAAVEIEFRNGAGSTRTERIKF